MRAPDPSPPATRSSFWRFVGRHRVIVAVLAVVGMLAGALYGFLAPTTYTAQSLLLVGTFEAPANAVPGYVLASQTTAGTYARLATSGQVLDRFATGLGISVEDARGKATVTAIPESTVIRVSATGDDADEARATAEAMASALDSYIGELNDVRSASLLQDYVAAQQDFLTKQAAATATNATSQLDRDAAQQKATALANQYQADQEAKSSSAGIQSLGAATVSEESKGLDTLVYIAIGLVVGAGLGIVVGLVLDARRRPRVADTEQAAGDGARPRHQKEGVGAR